MLDFLLFPCLVLVSKEVSSRHNYLVFESCTIVASSSLLQLWPVDPSFCDSVEHADHVVEYSATYCQEVRRVHAGGARFEDERIPGEIWSRGPFVTTPVEDITSCW